MRALAPAIAVLLSTYLPLSAATYLVAPDGSGDFPSIRAAVEAAVDEDTIELANGTFTGADNKNIAYLGKAITIRSQSGAADSCVIDCQGSGRAFAFLDAESYSSMLSGVTVVNGLVDDPIDYGGAVYCGPGASPSIQSCVFRNCRAGVGGALMGEGDSRPFVSQCHFEGNQAFGGGGAAFRETTRPTLIDCVFVDNVAYWGGGLAHASWYLRDQGGPSPSPRPEIGFGTDRRAPADRGPNLILQGCDFYDNESQLWAGGGVYFWFGELDASHCVFAGNRGDFWDEGGSGMQFSGPPEIPSHFVNCTFADNYRDEYYGGGIFEAWGGSLQLENCLFSGNDGRAIDGDFGNVTIQFRCSDLFGNTSGDWVGPYADQYGVNGNISENPLFCDAPNRDYTLDYLSPCLPANNTCEVQMGAYGAGCGGPTSAPEEVDVGAVTALEQNRPNPFNPRTTIRFHLADAGPVRLTILDVSGRLLRDLIAAKMPAGSHEVSWDGQDDAGRAVASGVYLYRLESGSHASQRKMLLLR